MNRSSQPSLFRSARCSVRGSESRWPSSVQPDAHRICGPQSLRATVEDQQLRVAETTENQVEVAIPVEVRAGHAHGPGGGQAPVGLSLAVHSAR